MLDFQVKAVGNLESFSVYYHNLFDYPLTPSELFTWLPKNIPQNWKVDCNITFKNGYYFLQGREGLIYKRTLRERFSKHKMEIATKAAKLLSKISTIKMVAISGSLAMLNAEKDSDIDLLIITKPNTLWISRLVALVLLAIFNMPTRRSNDSNQKDKLCLNIWLDEADLAWSKKERNVYTAHEIAQLIPLVNKNKVFEKFLYQNKWILVFWPKAIKVQSTRYEVQRKSHLSTLYSVLSTILESIAFRLQYQHRKNKITNETVTPTQAIFHPNDLSKIILKKLSS